MDPLTITALLAGAQMLSGADKEQRSKKLAAETQRYSPWTKLQAGPVNYADPVGTGMQAYGSYLGQQQAGENQQSQQKLLDAQTKYFNSLSMRGQQPIEPMATKQGLGTYGMKNWWDNG